MITATGSDPRRILGDPANFLHALDIDGDRAYFFRTDARSLRDASFVDGRIPIAKSEAFAVSLTEAAAAAEPASNGDRYMFNCSFCGSTLLARLLDVPGRSLVLKEPRALTDVAAWKTFQIRDCLPLDRLRPSLRLARAALRRPFAPGEAVTTKVACQGNVLLDDLAEDAVHIRPVFITISRPKFLSAIFRGGVERMHHAAKIAWNMAAGEPDGDAILRDAVKTTPDPLRKAANLAILAGSLQVGRFQRAAKAGHWSDKQVIDYEAIAKSPVEAAIKASRSLGLDLDEADIERNAERITGRYSKGPDETFSEERQRQTDDRVQKEYAQVFADALAWGESTLGPQRKVVP